MYVCIHASMDREYGVDPSLTHHYPLRGQQYNSIINVCVFVNTIQKEIEIDMVMDAE